MRLFPPALIIMASGLSLCGAGNLHGEGQVQGGAIESARVLNLAAPSSPGATFRFLPEGKSLAFDRPLLLSAVPGEERLYSVEIREGDSVTRRDILIDGRPPSPPTASLPSGVYDGPLTISLLGEKFATIRYSLSGPGSGPTIFRTWDSAQPIRLPAVEKETATWVLVAHALDASGNRGNDSRFVYRMRPLGFSAEPPFSDEQPNLPRPDAQVDVGQPRTSLQSGRSSLAFPAPSKGRLVAAVSPGSAINLAQSWTPLVPVASEAILDLECPYGWEGDLEVYIGIENGSILYKPSPFHVQLSNQGLPAKRPAMPASPRRLDGSAGFPSFLAFPSYADEILFSLDGAAETVYGDPLVIDPGKGKVHLSWRGRDTGGTMSDRQEADFDRPPQFGTYALVGTEGPERRSSALHLRTSAPDAVLRYEVTKDGSIPAEPGLASALLEGELVLDAPQGKTISYLVRYRPFSDASGKAVGGETTMLRSTIDREPPAKPWLLTEPAAYSRSAIKIELGTKEGRVFVSLGEESGESSFTEYRSALELPGGSEAPRSWFLSAYSIDDAGNRSAILGPLRYIVDTACVYLDSTASTGGLGSPERPYSELDRAMTALKDTGRSILRIRGEFALSTPLFFDSGKFRLEGGFGPDWFGPRNGSSRIRLVAPTTDRASLLLRNAGLSISGIDLSSGEGDGRVCELSSASLSLDSLSFGGRARTSLVLFNAVSSDLSIGSSSILLDGKGGGALITAEKSRISIRGSELRSSPGIGYFTGISMNGGKLELIGSRIASEANLSLVGMAMRAVDLDVDRCSFSFTGALGYLRCATFGASRGEIRNSHVEAVGSSLSSLIELRDSPVSFVHTTIIAGAFPAGLLFFDSRGEAPRLVNCLFIATDGAATLLSSDSPPVPGSIVACAFWGISTYLSGAFAITDTAKLSLLNGGGRYPPFVVLPGPSPLGRGLKGGLIPLPGTPIIDAAMVLAGGLYTTDFSGYPRPAPIGKGLPDIGADELQ
ncbi:MAG: hypothetical protein WCL50_07270 [Spirochaetota bacterium]